MKKVRINTTLRNKLEFYVKSQIEAGIDQTPLLAARERVQAEALRLIAEVYPAEDMAILRRYGHSRRYDRIGFLMPQGVTSYFCFGNGLPYDLPDQGTYFEPVIEADATFIVAAFDAATIEQALKAEASRQWKQAEVLIGCALYFEDVLDYLGIPAAERVSLAHRWHLPIAETITEPEPEIATDEDTWPSDEWDEGEGCFDHYSEEEEEEEALAA